MKGKGIQKCRLLANSQLTIKAIKKPQKNIQFPKAFAPFPPNFKPHLDDCIQSTECWNWPYRGFFFFRFISFPFLLHFWPHYLAHWEENERGMATASSEWEMFTGAFTHLFEQMVLANADCLDDDWRRFGRTLFRWWH
jgi:hypothetical protein